MQDVTSGPVTVVHSFDVSPNRSAEVHDVLSVAASMIFPQMSGFRSAAVQVQAGGCRVSCRSTWETALASEEMEADLMFRRHLFQLRAIASARAPRREKISA